MSIRACYQSQGALNYYKNNGHNYSNPHYKAIINCINEAKATWNLPTHNVLDLAAGSGEISTLFPNAVGCDPYTQQAYYNRIGKYPLNYSFEQIAQGAMANHSYNLIVCSFALHLAKESYLPSITIALAQISSKLLILTPHKKPIIKVGWDLIGELYVDRVRARYYEAT